MKEIILFAGSASQKLAGEICRELSIPRPGEVYLHKFPSGEHFCQYKNNIRGRDVFLIQSICNPAHERFMELLVMIDAAKRASAGRITVVTPYMGYLRQDRKTKSRTPITAKLAMNLLVAAGANRLVGIDYHFEQAQGFTDVPVDHLYAMPIFRGYFSGIFNPNELVIVAPDVGGVKRATAFAELLGCEMAFIAKKRLSDTTVQSQGIVGNVQGLNAIILDDMTESCGTLLEAAQVCRNHYAKSIRACVTHASLTGVGFDRLASDRTIKELVVTNTIDIDTCGLPIKVLSVANLLAKAIDSIHNDESVSSLFQINGF